MGTRTSRTAFPVAGARQSAAIGTWGIWLTIAVLGTAMAGLVVSGLYLRSGQPAWPPEGFGPPPLLRPTAALALTLAAGVTTLVASRVLRRGRERTSGHVLLGAVVLGATASTLLLFELIDAPFAYDEHVYTSMFWAFVGFQVLWVVIATLMTAATLVQRVAGSLDAGRHLELEITTAFWLFTGVTVVALYAMVHLLPYR